jgi:type IV secretory pathway VirB9-like protein
MRDFDAKLIELSEEGREIRYSDGKKVWPGFPEKTKLKKGYWVGTKSNHKLCENLGEAKKLLKGSKNA